MKTMAESIRSGVSNADFFVDCNSLESGNRNLDSIMYAILRSSNFAVLCEINYFRSGYCLLELFFALYLVEMQVCKLHIVTFDRNLPEKEFEYCSYLLLHDDAAMYITRDQVQKNSDPVVIFEKLLNRSIHHVVP